MALMKSMLLGAAVGMLSGYTALADTSTESSSTSNAPASSGPNVITPDNGDPTNEPTTNTAGVSSPQDETEMSQFTSTPVANLPQCNQYNATATVDGNLQVLNGEACQQPDGSWEIAEQPAGSTVVYQTIYWPPAGVVATNACFDNVYNYPCLYAFPFGFSVGIPVFIDIHHNFHRFAFDGKSPHFGPIGHFGRLDHFAHIGGFHTEFHNGFHGGFAGGNHGQFHGGFSGGGFRSNQ